MINNTEGAVMNILAKYPPPWRAGEGGIVASNGSIVLCGGCVGLDNAEASIEDDCRPLLLAVPEMLAALAGLSRTYMEHDGTVSTEAMSEAKSLLARLLAKD